MYIYNYFIILLGVCVSYDAQFDMIHDTKKIKIYDTIHNLTTMLGGSYQVVVAAVNKGEERWELWPRGTESEIKKHR